MSLQQIETEELVTVAGGVPAWMRAAGRVGARFVPFVNGGLAAYDGYSGYTEARERGASVGSSLAAGAKEAIKGATLYDLWGPSPAY